MSELLRPRSIVRLNGDLFPFIGWSVSLNTSSEADTFTLTADMKNSPIQYLMTSKDDYLVEIFYGKVAGILEPTSEAGMEFVISGYVDEVELDYDNDLVTLKGKDKTSVLIDKKLSQSFQNKNIATVISEVAQANGLTPVITAKGPFKSAGVLVNGNTVKVHTGTTAWDLLVKLAEDEGREILVKGNKLIYRDKLEPWQRVPVTFLYDTDIVGLTTNRGVRDSKSVAVTVKSWSSAQKKTFSYTAKRHDTTSRQLQTSRKSLYKKASQGHSADVEYAIVRPGLSLSEVKALAEKTADDIIRHELITTFETPLRQVYSLDNYVVVDKVPYMGRQHYFPTEITMSFDSSQGAKAVFKTINHILPIKGRPG